MKKKEFLIVFVLAILIEETILYFFEPGWIGPPVTFPVAQFQRLLAGAGASIDIMMCLSPILALIFWFLVLAVGWWVVKKLKTKK